MYEFYSPRAGFGAADTGRKIRVVGTLEREGSNYYISIGRHKRARVSGKEVEKFSDSEVIITGILKAESRGKTIGEYVIEADQIELPSDNDEILFSKEKV